MAGRHRCVSREDRSFSDLLEGIIVTDSFEQVRETTVFTTHTPVPAGHDIFNFQLMDKYFGSYLSGLDLDREEFLKLGVDTKTERLST